MPIPFAYRRSITRKIIHIDISRNTWKQFAGKNALLGNRFLRLFVLRLEVASYIAEHENAGVYLDTDCHELRYDDGIYLLLRRLQGVWYITDVILEDAPKEFEPVYHWRRIKRGFSTLLARVLVGWQEIRGTCSSSVQIDDDSYALR